MKRRIIQIIIIFVFAITICAAGKLNNRMKEAEDVQTNELEESAIEELQKWFDEWRYKGEGYGADAMEYQANWPCHFLVYVDMGQSTDTYEFRNVSAEGVWEDENANFGYMRQAYIADIVLDKYIREYGGKDTEYQVERKKNQIEDSLDEMWYLEISADDTKLIAIWSGYSTVVSVLILENAQEAETRTLEYITYLQYLDKYKESIGNTGNNKFGLILNPKSVEHVCYRNVQQKDVSLQNSEWECNSTDLYIIDQVVDRYIRDYQGSDEIYELKKMKASLCGKILTVEHDDEILVIEYSENSWLVSVEIQGSEMDLGVVSQKEIDSVAQMENVRKLRIALADDNMDLTPLKNLKELEELSIIVNSESKELDFSFFSELTHLKKLYIYEGYGEWSFLENLKELEELVIMCSEVENLSFLQELTQLRELSVYWINDADIENIKKLDKLEYLHIEGYNVRNTECLTAMKNINTIHLAEMQSTPAYGESICMGTFSEMNKLERLYLIRMRIEDITPISELPSIETLVLVDTGIESIQSLENLPKLKELEVYGEISEEIENEARKYLSNLESIVIQDEIPKMYSSSYEKK